MQVVDIDVDLKASPPLAKMICVSSSAAPAGLSNGKDP